jgi:hypothetical protein
MNLPKKFGKPRQPGEKTTDQKAQGRKNDLQWSLSIGEITRVDYEKMICDIRFLSGSRPPALEVPISSAYWSKRAFLGAMPEEGALAICGFMDAHEGKMNKPLILSFLPNGSKTALRYHPLGHSGERDAEELDVPEDALQTDLEGIYGVDRHKMRKIYPGDIFAMSEQGSELLLNQSVRLFNRGGSEFQLRDEDNSSILSTLDFYRTTAASRKRSGRVIRNALNVPSDFTGEDEKLDENHPLFEEFVDAGLIFEDGTLVDDVNSLPATRLSDGERHSVITENLQNPDSIDSSAFVEERTEIQEFSDQRIPHGQELGIDSDRIEEDHFSPFIEKVTGTVIGNNPFTSMGRSRYGQLLRPSIFKSPDDSEGNPSMEIVDNEASEKEKNLVAASLYRMQRSDNRGELFFSHDKEGHVFFSIPSSTSKTSNLGGGRSIEGDVKGSTKLTMGANNNDNESLDIQARGGFNWNLGTINSSNRSLDLSTEGGVGINVKGSDVDGSALNAKFTGNCGISITGDKGESISGEFIQEIGGKKRLTAQSVNESIGSGGMDRTVMGDRRENISGKKEEQIGKGHSKTIVKSGKGGPNAEKTDIKAGNRQVKFLAPAKDEIQFTSTGTISRKSTGPMSYTMSTPAAGQFSTSANTGVYNVTMNSGSINLTASAGVINITSGVTVSIQSSNISLTGSVGLGGGSGAPNSVIGGVPGPSPHIDYILGIPLTGNPLVRTV